MKKNYKCIIIGSGVAGMTAAIYLNRLNVDTLIIEAKIPGGQIVNTSIIENYPGFNKIDGATLALNINNQVKNLGIPYLYENVKKIILKDDKKIVITDTQKITCDYIIIASGRIPNKLNIPQEEEYLGRGISYCAICDGLLYKNKEVIVVGGGNSAIEESLYLAKICKKVVILNRSDKLKADSYLIKKIQQLKNVEIKYNSEIKKLKIENNQIKGVYLKTNEEIKAEGIFIFIGLTPKLDYLKGINIEIEKNYLKVNKNMETNINNIYASGDVIKKDVYQITTAIGEATVAAVNIARKVRR